MKTIAVQKEIREMLEEYAEVDETMDETISRLLESVKFTNRYDESYKTNINVSEETFKKLKNAKLYNTERNVCVIARLLYSIQ